MGNPNADVNDDSHPNRGGYYNWFQAAGYAKDQATSQNETSYNAEPGSGTACFGGMGNVVCQPVNPISVCAEVDPLTHKIIGGGAVGTYDYQDNPETLFKGELKALDGVLWRLPSRDDFMLAEVNGMRKVLRHMDDMDENMSNLNSIPHIKGGWFYFWTSTSSYDNRSSAWYFGGTVGDFWSDSRNSGNAFVRCVALWHD